jgi:hypothetical protein
MTSRYNANPESRHTPINLDHRICPPVGGVEEEYKASRLESRVDSLFSMRILLRVNLQQTIRLGAKGTGSYRNSKVVHQRVKQS